MVMKIIIIIKTIIVIIIIIIIIIIVLFLYYETHYYINLFAHTYYMYSSFVYFIILSCNNLSDSVKLFSSISCFKRCLLYISFKEHVYISL